jgi:hypothetical protein
VLLWYEKENLLELEKDGIYTLKIKNLEYRNLSDGKASEFANDVTVLKVHCKKNKTKNCTP